MKNRLFDEENGVMLVLVVMLVFMIVHGLMYH